MKPLRTICELASTLWRHSGVRFYGANMIWLSLEKVVRVLVGLSVGIYVARSLGPSEYGLLNYAISFVSIFSVLVGMGLDVLVVRELVRAPNTKDELLGTALILKLAGFVLMFLGMEAALWAVSCSIEGKSLIRIVGIGCFFQTFQVLDCYFQAKVQCKYVALTQIVALLTVACFRGYGAWRHSSLAYFAWIEVIYAALVSLGYMFFFHASTRHWLRWKFRMDCARRLLCDAWPLLLGSCASIIYTRLDQVLITKMIGMEANGQYAVAVRLVELVYILSIICCTTLFPSIVGMRHTSLARYYYRIRFFIGGMFWWGLLLVVPAALGGYFVIRFLYGEAFSVGGVLYLLFCLKLPIVFAGGAIGQWYMAENMQRISLAISIAGALCYIPLLLLLLHLCGVYGGVWASIWLSLLNVLFFPLLWKKGRYGILLGGAGIKQFPVWLLRNVRQTIG